MYFYVISMSTHELCWHCHPVGLVRKEVTSLADGLYKSVPVTCSDTVFWNTGIAASPSCRFIEDLYPFLHGWDLWQRRTIPSITQYTLIPAFHFHTSVLLKANSLFLFSGIHSQSWMKQCFTKNLPWICKYTFNALNLKNTVFNSTAKH